MSKRLHLCRAGMRIDKTMSISEQYSQHDSIVDAPTHLPLIPRIFSHWGLLMHAKTWHVRPKLNFDFVAAYHLFTTKIISYDSNQKY